MDWLPMTYEEKMHAYGLTEEDMKADIDTLSDETATWRFKLEFNATSFIMCFATGDPGHFDGENFRYRPEDQTDEDEMALIRESLKQKKNLFIERWTNIAHYLDGVDY
ncbi:MAG: hypothetical protein IKU43_07120 [Clostridia bacterium]|nr:hypothetical protein [Clostridia bacterium]